MYRFLPLLFFAFALAACGDETADRTHEMPDGTAMHDHEMTATVEPAAPRMEDGVQVVEIEAGPKGYVPRTVALEASVPARIVFTRTVESECSSQVQVPAFDVPTTDLPLNEPVAVEFTPTVGGDFEFVCGMDMQRGSLLIQS